MKYSDADALPPADVSEFVTYMTPEFQQDDDDGTDLPLPDISSLVVPALKTGRRVRPGRHLRDTVVEAGSEPEEQAFGDGLDIAESERAAGTLDKSAVTRESSQPPDSQIGEQIPKKSRQGRRPRTGSRSTHTRTSGTSAGQLVDGQETDHPPRETPSDAMLTGGEVTSRTAQSEADPDADGYTDNASGARDNEGAKSGTRKRRRRRNPRKKISRGSDIGNEGGSQPTLTDGGD